ncbi:MAG TPA: sigma-70 family RNA polymerase sigma factor [Candidatus Dormibacteraeota bacterium]
MARGVAPERTDPDLAALLAAGDLDALAELYDRYGALAYSVAVRVLGDAGLAEDAVQESFLALWRNAGQFDAGRGSLRSWLLTSTRNRAVDRLRGRGAHERRELELEAAAGRAATGAGSDPWREVSAGLEREAVVEALGRLPAEQRQVVELAYFGGYTHREIAELLRVPASTVKGRMRLALEKLHSYLEGKGVVG